MRIYKIMILALVISLLPVIPSKASGEGEAVFSWLGNSYSGETGLSGSGSEISMTVPHDVAAMYVSPDTGRLYTNAFWNESGNNFSEITDGELTNVGMHSHGWGYEGGYAVTANSKYVYFGQSASYQSARDGNDNWPEEGYAWFGVTRRLVSDIQSGDPFNGMKTGGGIYFMPIDNIPVYTPDQSSGEQQPEGTVSGSSECVISGLAATESELFVSDTFEDKIKVYDADSMVKKREWACPGPGQLALDSNGNLWVVMPEDDQILCFDTYGNPLRVISVRGGELWAIAATGDGRLLAADRGEAECIRVYTGLNSNSPKLEGFIGETGGIFSGDGNGCGKIGDRRFYGITGVGADAGNNIYVCSGGAFDPSDDESFGTTFLESYTESGTLRWRLYGLEFLDSAVADPGDPTSVYTKFERFKMDYSQPPGQEWSYEGYTLNPHKYPDDFRLKDNSMHVIAVRTIGGVKTLYATGMYGHNLYVYRFDPETDGETAIPCMAVYDDTQERKVTLMQDTTGDGSFDSFTPICPSDTFPKYDHVWVGWDIDADGTIRNSRVSKQIIDEYKFEGINENGVPVWSYTPLETGAGIAAPAPFNGETVGDINENQYADLRMCRYDAENDVMYLTGAFDSYTYEAGQPAQQMTAQSKSPGDTIARFENWSKGNRKPAYVRKFDYSTKLYQNKYLNLNAGFAVSGDYIFVCESAFTELGALHIYEAETGEKVQDIEYDQCFGELGLLDIVMPLSAVQLPDGRYMILLEEDLHGKILIIYWQPPDAYTFSETDFSEIEQNGSVSLSMTRISPQSGDVYIYFAVYENDKLIDIRQVIKTDDEMPVGEEITASAVFDGLKVGCEIRVMAWTSSQRPLKPAESYRISK